MLELAVRGIPFIICSAALPADEMGKGHSDTVLLPKPYTRESLVKAVSKVCERCLQ